VSGAIVEYDLHVAVDERTGGGHKRDEACRVILERFLLG
jgi:hypothetical protein